VPDPQAKHYFDAYLTPTGKPLTAEESRKYYNNATILNAIRTVWDRMLSAQMRTGSRMTPKNKFWAMISDNMAHVTDKYENSLPWNARRLQQQAETYYGVKGTDRRFESLLKTGKYGNQNRTIASPAIERLLVSIYASKEKPFMSDVKKIYDRFIAGEADIVDYETGEIVECSKYTKNGQAAEVSDATVWRILNKPVNRRIADSRRNDFKYNQKHDVYVKRESPHYSLSKISLDDRDLCRKTVDGKWVHAYYAYDVASGCVIGAAYALKKDTNLVKECLRDMWKNLEAWNLKTPYEAEVENHLMKELSDRLNNTFTHVTWCAPMNSREKRAEHFNRQKKYFGPESERSQGMAHGRHYARHEAYLYSREKIFDEDNHNYKPELVPALLDAIIAEDRAQIEKYNNQRHPNAGKRKEFEDMTRMQVLVMKMNPNLAPLNHRLICRNWGYETETSLKASNLMTVQYEEWVLTKAEMVGLFKPNNYECRAYWLPSQSGEIESIFVYQDETYIDECRRWGTFQEAVAERTARDTELMHRQMGRKQNYRKMIRDARNEVPKVKIIDREKLDAVIEKIGTKEDLRVKHKELKTSKEMEYSELDYADDDWYSANAINSL
jgi:hypothetical protein